MNLAFGTRTDLLTLIAELESVLGVRLIVDHVESRAGDVRHSQADSSRLQELFPDVEPAPLSEALRATVDWFRAAVTTRSKRVARCARRVGRARAFSRRCCAVVAVLVRARMGPPVLFRQLRPGRDGDRSS